MIVFLDTSALVKLYIAEPGSQALQERLTKTIAAVSELTYAETYATFARRLREELLSPGEHQRLCSAFEADWATLLRIPFSDAVLGHIPDLCRRHPLRGADAMQLSCALMLRDEDVDVIFATSDQRLLEAACSEGLTVFDPVDPEHLR